VVVCAPSGSGKTSICKAFMERNSHARYSISLTTRLPRAEEVNGVDYRFVSDVEFQKAVDKDELAEYEMAPAANAQRNYKKAKSARSGESKLEKVIAAS